TGIGAALYLFTIILATYPALKLVLAAPTTTTPRWSEEFERRTGTIQPPWISGTCGLPGQPSQPRARIHRKAGQRQNGHITPSNCSRASWARRANGSARSAAR